MNKFELLKKKESIEQQISELDTKQQAFKILK